MFRQSGNPAARVYESIGSDFFLAPAPGWLNLGWWEGPGSEGEAEDACRRLVRTLALALPARGTILDVGNGLGTQDRLIAEVARPAEAAQPLADTAVTEFGVRTYADGRSALARNSYRARL